MITLSKAQVSPNLSVEKNGTDFMKSIPKLINGDEMTAAMIVIFSLLFKAM
jgi:hypothetical protein